jgi:hypothetical protein
LLGAAYYTRILSTKPLNTLLPMSVSQLQVEHLHEHRKAHSKVNVTFTLTPEVLPAHHQTT